MTELSGQGMPYVECREIVNTTLEPLKEVEGLIRSRKIGHDGDPVMTWMLSERRRQTRCQGQCLSP